MKKSVHCLSCNKDVEVELVIAEPHPVAWSESHISLEIEGRCPECQALVIYWQDFIDLQAGG